MVQKEAERIQAIALRRQGLSYREILTKVSVAKSSLSLWLQDVGLSKKQKQRLTAKKWASLQRGLATIRADRMKRREDITKDAAKEVKEYIEDPLWLLGTALYWAEGSKLKPWNSQMVAFSNMDASTHLIVRQWFKKYLKVSESNLTYELYIHKSSSGRIGAVKKYWSRVFGIPTEKIRVYYKKNTLSTRRKNIGSKYFGVIDIRVRKSAALNHRINDWIAGLCKEYCRVV